MENNKKIVGYIRETVIKNDTLAIQEELLKRNQVEEIVSDTFNGKNREKPNLAMLLKKLDKEDILMISRLDIIADSTKEAYEILLDLHKRGVIINILDMGIIDNTKTGIAILNTIQAFIVFDKNIRTKHLQEGRTKSRRNINYKDGRKTKYTREQKEEAIKMLDNNSYDIVAKSTGISRSTLSRYKKEKEKNAQLKLEDYYKEAREESIKLLEDIGIEIGEISSWKTFSDNTENLGWCYHNKDGSFTIAIREQLFDREKVAKDKLMDTILHELIHAEKNLKGYDHGKDFQRMAKKVNKEYGYNISTYDEDNVWEKEYKLVWLCKNCGYANKRDKRGKARCYKCENTTGTFFKKEDFEKFRQLFEDDYANNLYRLNDEIYSVPTKEELERILRNDLMEDNKYHGEAIYKTKNGYKWNYEVLIFDENNVERKCMVSAEKSIVEMINAYSEKQKTLK